MFNVDVMWCNVMHVMGRMENYHTRRSYLPTYLGKLGKLPFLAVSRVRCAASEVPDDYPPTRSEIGDRAGNTPVVVISRRRE